MGKGGSESTWRSPSLGQERTFFSLKMEGTLGMDQRERVGGWQWETEKLGEFPIAPVFCEMEELSSVHISDPFASQVHV